MQRCNKPDLHTLKIEYLADEDEDDLLSFIPTAFPHLELLRLCRYGTQEPGYETALVRYY